MYQISGLMPLSEGVEIPSRRVVLLIGPNMSGKTRVMMAIYYLHYIAELMKVKEIDRHLLKILWEKTIMSRPWYTFGRGGKVEIGYKGNNGEYVKVSMSSRGRGYSVSFEGKGDVGRVLYLFQPGLGEFYESILLFPDTGEPMVPLPITESIKMLFRDVKEKDYNLMVSSPYGMSVRIDKRKKVIRIQRQLPHTKNPPSYPIRSEAAGVKSVALLTLALSIPDDILIMLDEPEAGLHPQWIRDEVQGIVRSGKRFIIATHSPLMVEEFNLAIAKGNLSADEVAGVYFRQQKNGDIITETVLLRDGMRLDPSPLTLPSERQFWELMNLEDSDGESS